MLTHFHDHCGASLADFDTPADATHKPILADKYKTKPCRNYQLHNFCPYEFRCMFAHGPDELRTKEMNLRDGLVSEEAIRNFRRMQLLKAEAAAAQHYHHYQSRHDTNAPYLCDCGCGEWIYPAPPIVSNTYRVVPPAPPRMHPVAAGVAHTLTTRREGCNGRATWSHDPYAFVAVDPTLLEDNYTDDECSSATPARSVVDEYSECEAYTRGYTATAPTADEAAVVAAMP